MAKTIEQRRKLRTMEAKRDALLAKKTQAVSGLAVVRAEIRHLRRTK